MSAAWLFARCVDPFKGLVAPAGSIYSSRRPAGHRPGRLPLFRLARLLPDEAQPRDL
jgi:hypothetical protein